MKNPFLRVKIKSLAAEAKMIRREENFFNVINEPQPKIEKGDPRPPKVNRWRPDADQMAVRASLHSHRVHEVRPEARAAQLAYGFLRGKPYRSMEQKTKETNPLPKEALERLIKKYGTHNQLAELDEWLGVEDNKQKAGTI